MKRVTLIEFQEMLKSKPEVTLSEDIYLEEPLIERFKSRFTDSGLTQFKFHGVLDGDGHTIHNVTSRLFKCVEGCVRNVTLQSAECISESPLCELNQGRIENVTVTVPICTDREICGGLVTKNKGTITESEFCGNSITSSEDGMMCNGCGGVAETNDGLITHCSVSTDISGFRKSGGIVQDNCGKLTNCEFTGYISGETKAAGISTKNNSDIHECNVFESTIKSTEASKADVGGICAVNKIFSEISNSACQDVTLNTGSIGGVSGVNSGRIVRCSFDGSINGSKSSGGLCGRLVGVRATLEESHFSGTITSEEQYGGLCGLVNSGATCSKCYSDSDELSGSSISGVLFGLLSYDTNNPVTIENCFYIGDSERGSELVGIDERIKDEDGNSIGVHQVDIPPEQIQTMILIAE